jgi:hypothetical protein
MLAVETLDPMSEDKAFADQMDTAKFAMSIAIRRGAKPGEVTGVGTKWNVGSFDPDGQLRNLLPIIYPDLKTPYRALESLIDASLHIVAQEHLKGGTFDIAAALKSLEPKQRKRQPSPPTAL